MKKKLSSKVSSFNIDEIYKLLKSNGAYGGKLLGAGGGGFLLVVANKSVKNILKKKLYKLKFVNFEISEQGSTIIAAEKNIFNNYWSHKLKISIITPTYRRHNLIKKNYNIIRKNFFNNNLEWIILSEYGDNLTNNLIKTFELKICKTFYWILQR